MLSDDSGGGSFFLGVALTALTGASSLLLVSLSQTLAPGSEAIGACDEADIVELFVVAFDSCQMSVFAVRTRKLETPTRRTRLNEAANARQHCGVSADYRTGR
jgi:hypothetical protein